MNLVWQTRLSLDECVVRLKGSMDSRRISRLMGPFAPLLLRGVKPVLGKITGSEFTLEKRRWYRNNFAPVFLGKLADDPQGGTMIYGHFVPGLGISLRGLFWFFFWSWILVNLVNGIVSGSRNADCLHCWVRYSIRCLQFVVGWYLALMFLEWLKRNERYFIADFIQETVEAVPVTNDGHDVL